MYQVLKSTTSLTMCLALALPTGALSQSTPETCATDGAQVQFPCVLPDGTEATGMEQLMESIGAAALETTEQPSEAEVEAQADAEADTEATAAAEDAADDSASDEAAAAAQAIEDEAAAAQAAAEEAATAQQEAEIEAQIAVDAEAAAEEAVVDEDAPADEAGAEATADSETAPVVTEETAPVVTEETAPVVTEETAPVVTEETAPVVTEETAPVVTEETQQTETEQSEAAAEAAPVAEDEAAPEEDTAPESDQEAAEAAPAEDISTPEQIEADLVAQQEAEESRAEQRAADAAAASEAAEAADSGETEVDVTTEEVTEEDTRSSSEEFETAVTGQADAQAPASTEEDDGLSNFEKALIVGLGAVAVGTVLNNGSRVVSNSGDRLVVEDPNGDLRVLKDDTQLVRQAGDQVRRENFSDGSSRTIVTKPDGSQVVTIQGRDGTVLRRVNVDTQGNEYVLFDDTRPEERIIVNDLPEVQQSNTLASQQDEDALRRALQSQLRGDQARTFSLRQIRDVQQVRALAPEVELDAVRFATGSAAIQPEQACALAKIGVAISDAIANDPRTVILVEGHTDAVGDEGYNLALSDRRAETVALALTEYFDVPASNLITQGYGEGALKVHTLTAEPANRRAVVRNITGLLRD